MRALTLKQPWGYAHEYLGKRVENRTWTIKVGRYALHVGKSLDKAGTEYIEAQTGPIDWSKMKYSVIFAVCDIVRVVGDRDLEALKNRNRIPESQTIWTFGPVAHFYDERTFRILPTPVQANGSLGTWDLDPARRQAVLAELRAAGPRVLNMHSHGKPDGSVVVMRGTKWGNPFSWRGDTSAKYLVPKDDVLTAFEEWITGPKNRRLLDEGRTELVGRDLVCCCAPGPCHADIWLRLVNPDLSIERRPPPPIERQMDLFSQGES